MAQEASRQISCEETICSDDKLQEQSPCHFLAHQINFFTLPTVSFCSSNFINVVVTIGTPGQKLALQIDTGSSDIWVEVPESRLCQLRTNPCATTGTYENTTSLSYKYVNSLFSIQYADNTQAVGDYATETFQIGSMSTYCGNVDSRRKNNKHAIWSRNRCHLNRRRDGSRVPIQ